MKILLAEDSPTNRGIIEILLNRMDLEVESVENGQEAVRMAQQNNYDLILMDLAMPVMDGLEATRKIRSGNGVNKNTRIVAIAADALDEDIERCFAAGMNDFVTKPINFSSFRTEIQLWLKGNQDSESLTKKSELVDLTIFKQLQKDTGVQALPGILELFNHECGNRLPVMMDGYKKQNWKVLEDEAHALKSSSGNFGAIKLQALARKIELAAKSKDQAVFDKIIPTLEEIIRLSIEELQKLVSQN